MIKSYLGRQANPSKMDQTSQILPILQQIPLFASLDQAKNQEIIQKITLQYYPVGHVFFQEGALGGTMYILKKGKVNVVQGGKELKILSENDFFGEMSLFSDKPRNATIQAIEETEAFSLKKEDIIDLVNKNPEIASQVSDTFIDRSKENNN